MYVMAVFVLLYLTSTSQITANQISTTTTTLETTESDTTPLSSSSTSPAFDQPTTILTESETETETTEKSPELSLVLMEMKTQLKVNQVFEKEHKKQQNSGHGKIVLLGLFELTTKLGPRPEGLSELSAAQMAVQHINSKQLLPGYTLELLTNDTQVSFYRHIFYMYIT